MRQVQLEDAEQQFSALIKEAESGESMLILRGGKPVAKIVPAEKPRLSEAERMAAVERLKAIMDHGYDLGGFKITNRDELYDRD